MNFSYKQFIATAWSMLIAIQLCFIIVTVTNFDRDIKDEEQLQKTLKEYDNYLNYGILPDSIEMEY